MKPTQPTDRSSGAILRQAGAVVMVGTQMAVPRAAMPGAVSRLIVSGFIHHAVSRPTSTAAGPVRSRLFR